MPGVCAASTVALMVSMPQGECSFELRTAGNFELGRFRRGTVASELFNRR